MPHYKFIASLQSANVDIRRILISILALIPLAYLIRLKNYFFYWDGVDIAYYLNHPAHRYMFHQHHLAFAPFCNFIYSLLKLLGLSWSSLGFLIIFNIIWGLIFLFICHRIFVRILPKFPYSGIWGILIISISYTFVTYLRNSDQYILPVLFLSLICFRVLREIPKGIFKVTIFDWFLFYLAILFHQMSFLFLPALFYAEMHTPQKRFFKTLVIKLLVLISILSVTYILTFWMTQPEPTFASFCFWLKGYANHPFWVFSGNQEIGESFRQSVTGSFFSHKALFLAPVDRSSILRLPEYRFHYYDQAIGNIINYCLAVVISVLLFTGIFITLFSGNYLRRVSIFCLIWILPFFIFLQLFVPYQTFYRLFYLLPLVIFILASVENLHTKLYSRIFAILFLISFGIYNYAYGYLPESKPYNNPYLVFAKVVKEKSGKNDLFILPDQDYFYGKYLRYFGKRDVAWIRKFSKERYPEATNEMIMSKNQKSIEYLKNKYRRIFIPTYTDVSYDTLMIIPLSGVDPKYLIVFPEQLKIIREKRFFDRVFYNITLDSDIDNSKTPSDK